MNRRNFLKLLGLTVLPIPALAATVPETVYTGTPDEMKWTDNSDWLILETPYNGLHRVEVDNEGVDGQYSYVARNHDAVYYDHGKGTSQFLKVTEQSRIIVTAPSGQVVWFSPRWNTVYNRFETVVIKSQKHTDVYSHDDNGTVEERYTVMTARLADGGELIGKTIKDVRNL